GVNCVTLPVARAAAASLSGTAFIWALPPGVKAESLPEAGSPGERAPVARSTEPVAAVRFAAFAADRPRPRHPGGLRRPWPGPQGTAAHSVPAAEPAAAAVGAAGVRRAGAAESRDARSCAADPACSYIWSPSRTRPGRHR